MKRKINHYLLLVGSLVLAATLVITVAIFHHMYREQIIQDMKSCAEVIRDMTPSGEALAGNIEGIQTDVRITVISRDGEVVYDSETDSGGLGNHADRPEVAEAERTGSSYSVRHSDTLDRDMYYYAVRLKDGDILRISKEEGNIWNVFYNTMSGIGVIAGVMILICCFLSRYAAAEIVRPIEQLAKNIENAGGVDTYEELVPFITKICQQHEDILKSSRMRQEFTANVSHELKTPLTSISGYAELIETGIAGKQEVRRFAGEIRRNSKRLLTLINDIIRLSELDSGHMEIDYTDMDLYEAARTCVEMLRLQAESHEICIECHGENAVIHANREMMEELLYNLCDNAIRYNRRGGRVDVTVSRDDGHVRLSVRDTGIGIPKESQARIFERFYRVDKSRSKQTGGTGLGLAIVKHIVAQHHAQLELHSEVNQGTEMTVIF